MFKSILLAVIFALFIGVNGFSQQATHDTVIERSAPVLTIVEEMPVFPGGEEMLYKFLGENIRYPAEAKEKGITGTVFIKFIIEMDGSISNVEILKNIGGGCGEEAARVVSIMPKWKPGTQNKKPVRVYFNLPIKFTL